MFKKIFSLFAALTLCVGLWAAAPANVESVDLGLPSGLKWATFNVGATAPEGNGDYFAWGETEPYYSSQDPITWKTGKETGYSWQSYCGSSSFDEWSTAPYDATTKNLKPEFDAATANWGSDWRMPTKAEQDELRTECTWTWTEDYNGTGIKGYIVTSKAEGNTNSIFLPASGFRNNSSLNDVGSYGYCWSSSLYESYSGYAYYLEFASNNVGRSSNSRYYGRSVRPVTTKLITPAKTSVITYTASEKLPEVTGQYASGLHTNAFYAADSTLLTITEHSFNDGVGTITLDGEVAIIGFKAFYKCEKMTAIEIPNTVTHLGKGALEYLYKLTSLTLPEGLIEIGENALYGDTSLVSLTIPASVTTIGKDALFSCFNLTSLVIETDNTQYDSRDNCNAVIETATNTLLFGAGCTTIPATVTTIAEYAFYCAHLTSLVIPASVDSIGGYAFIGCNNLASVTFESNACQNAIGSRAFSGVGSSTPALLTLPNSWTGTLPDEDGNWYGGKFELSEEPTPPQTWGEWEDFAPLGLNTGKYTFSAMFNSPQTQANIPVQVRKDNTGLKQYKFIGWGKGLFTATGIDLIVDMGPDNVCTVAKQDLGLDPGYGENIQVQDYASKTGQAVPSTYDPETGTFNLALSYFISLGSFGSDYETMVMDKLITERDTVKVNLNAFTIVEDVNSQTGAHRGWLFQGQDTDTLYVIQVLGQEYAGTFSYADGTLGKNFYNVVPSNGQGRCQFTEGTVTTAQNQDGIITLVGEFVGQDEKAYVFHWSMKLGVLQYDADAPFDATFAYEDMESSISNGVISISATNAEGLTIGLELYANPTATTIPEGVYTISDSQEAGTALKSVGMTGGFLNECFAGIRAASGAFADTWFMVEGTVTLSYDEYGKLKVVVDAKNSYEQPVTALVQYSTTPTALPTLFGDGVKGNKFLRNGQLIIRKGAKLYNAVGQEIR